MTPPGEPRPRSRSRGRSRERSRERAIFVEIFGWTFLLLTLMTAAAAALFAGPFISYFNDAAAREVAGVFAPLVSALNIREPGDVARLARAFAARNQSFAFVITDAAGGRVFATDGFDERPGAAGADGADGADAADAADAAGVDAADRVEPSGRRQRWQIFVSRAVGAPAVGMAIGETDVDATAPGVTAVDDAASGATAIGATAVDDAASGATAIGATAVDDAASGVIAVSATAPGATAVSATTLGVNTAIGATPGATAVSATAPGATAVSAPAPGVTAVGDAAPDATVVGVTPGATAPGAAAPAGYTLRVYSTGAVPRNYGVIIRKTALAVLAAFALALAAAFLFARRVARPLVEELERERRMEERQRAFFSAASHELKTPIAAMTAVVEGMAAGVGDYADHPRYLRECLRMLDAQNRLVTEILEIARLPDETVDTRAAARRRAGDSRAGDGRAAGDVTAAPFPLAEVVDALAAEYRPIARGNGLEIQVERAGLDGLTVDADRRLFTRALSNVVSNAAGHTRPGETVRIWVSPGPPPRLNVLNTGARLDEEAPERRFEPFALSAGLSRRGLGLTIVKRILDRLGLAFGFGNAEAGVLFWIDLRPDRRTGREPVRRAGDPAERESGRRPR